jgi:hypothetical protein
VLVHVVRLVSLEGPITEPALDQHG